MTDISKLDKHDIGDLLPLLCSLYPSIDPSTIEARLYNVAKTNWECSVIRQEEDVIALSGFRIMDRICYGKFMYIDHFIVDEAYRGKLIANDLLNHLVEIAQNSRCSSIILDTFITNPKAQRLWLNNKFRIVGFHFQRVFEG